MTRQIGQIAAATLLVGVIGAIALLIQQPLLVPSVAAAAFIQVLLPEEAVARPWSIGLGQLVGAGCGFAAVYVAEAKDLPIFTGAHPLLLARVIATMLAVAGTMIAQLLLKASSAPGGTLALFVALGMETPDVAGIVRTVVGVAVITALGEAARRLILLTPP